MAPQKIRQLGDVGRDPPCLIAEKKPKLTERTTPISFATHRVGTMHGCRRAQPCYDHCGLHRVWRSDRIGAVGRGEAVSARQVM